MQEPTKKCILFALLVKAAVNSTYIHITQMLGMEWIALLYGILTKQNNNIKIKFYGKVTDLSVIKTLCQQEYECWVGYIDWKNTEILPSTGGTMLWFAFDWIVCGLCYGKMFYLNMDTLTWS